MNNQKDILRRIGQIEQLSGVKDYTFNEGKAKNVRALEMYTSEGLNMTVLPDRGMDIASLKYKGINISYLSKTGIVNPQFFVEDGSKGFFRNFYAGFLTTGGLSYMGASSHFKGRELGLHGMISNVPAYNVSYLNNIFEDISLEVKGKVKEAEFFGDYLVLTRSIQHNKKENTIYINDNIKNHNFEPSSFMILYHMNYGYPFLSPDLEIDIPTSKVVARDKNSVIKNHESITEPVDDAIEEVFFHEVIPDEKGIVKIRLNNYKLGIGVEISYSYLELPYLTQWKSMKSGEYVLGIEPGNYNVKGKDHAQKNSALTYLNPLEEKKISLKIKLIDL